MSPVSNMLPQLVVHWLKRKDRDFLRQKNDDFDVANKFEQRLEIASQPAPNFCQRTTLASKSNAVGEVVEHQVGVLGEIVFRIIFTNFFHETGSQVVQQQRYARNANKKY
jgi:hypothetical protein